MRATALALAVTLVAVACEEGTSPAGTASSFDVYVYVELDDTAGMGAGDLPVAATVTVAGENELLLVDSTGADGHVRFEGLRSGSYTVSHVATSQPPATEIRGSPAQTVVAPFEGIDVETRFIYGYAPGTLTGVTYRDDNGSGAFEAGLDSVFGEIELLIFAGSDTTAAATASTESGEDGRYDLGELEPGAYALLIRPRTGTAVVGGNPQPITIVAGEPTFYPIEFVGEPID